MPKIKASKGIIRMLQVQSFFDKDTCTLTHVVWDDVCRDAVIIDPVMEFNNTAWTTSTKSVEEVLRFCKEMKCKVHYSLETHAHADHLSGSQLIKSSYPSCKTAIGKEITQVQSYFSSFFNTQEVGASEFDELYEEGLDLYAGSLRVKPLHTPGHTPACYSLMIGKNVFVGDAIFAADLGTGRCDFPGGSPQTLYRSIKEKIYSLPDDTTVYFGHDYPSATRDLRISSSLGDLKKSNAKISTETSEEDFVRDRSQRDATLSLPRLIMQSMFVNIRAGKLPQVEANGKGYLKIPVTFRE
jgi:glyoxylase-like metal-dependent hydrolase (beta-lactamase superfamily II)